MRMLMFFRPGVGTVGRAFRDRKPVWINDLHENADRKSTRLNSSHVVISYAVFCLKKKTHINTPYSTPYPLPSSSYDH